MPGSPSGLSGRLKRFSIAVENAALVFLLGAMILLATSQIAMRLFLGGSVVWADAVIELIVLWIALIASIAAARSGRHLSIDILSHLLPGRLARLPLAVAAGFAAGICGLIAWESWRYVQLTREFEETVVFGAPAWVAYGILPLAFGLMTWHFAKSALRNAYYLAFPPDDETEEKPPLGDPL